MLFVMGREFTDRVKARRDCLAAGRSAATFPAAVQREPIETDHDHVPPWNG
jgi:hypothetical protein